MDTDATAPPKDTTNNSQNGLQVCMPRQRDRDISTRGRRQAFREDTPTVYEGIDDALETEPRPSTSRGRWTPPPWTPDELVFCRENHISHRPLTSIVDGVLRHHGSGAGDLIPWLYRIIKGDPITNALWESAGLGDFYSAVVGFRSPRGCGSIVVRALLEYFWDTTNTFHFAWGEMTVTPLDFSMISGLRFTERPVLQIPDLTWGASEATELLGPVVQHIRTRPVSRGGHRSGRSELASVLAHGFDIAETTPEQRVRIFILILISGTLSHDRSSRALICYLPSLVRIGEIGSYSWASIGYADLLSSMRHGCRQLNDQSLDVVYGLWRVVELWFYEYFPGLAPRRRRGAVHDFPVGASWRDRGESRVESVSSLRGLLRRGTSTVGVAVEIQYRPWDGMTDLPEALELSACRTVFFGTTRFVWYLGERVVRQHSANHFVVPLPPPESMLDSRLLGKLLDRGERYTFLWQELVRMESDYSQELLPSLAPPPRLPETTARRRGKVELPPQSVRYPGPIGMIEEHIADAPEGFRQAQESMPDEFEPLTHSDMMGFMKLIDDLKHCIIKLRCGASCQSGSDDANEERRRSRSRSRHRCSDEGEPSHRKQSPEVRRHSRTQRQQPSQPFQGFQTQWPQSQFSQPFQETQWQQTRPSQPFQETQWQQSRHSQPFQPSQPEYRPVITPTDQGLFSVPLFGMVPPRTIPASWSQPTQFTRWTVPASSVGAVGTSRRDTTPRTRMMEGLFGLSFPYSRPQDDSDPSSGSE